MVSNEQLTERVRTLAKHKGMSEKKMFGGIAFMLGGNMCFGVLKDDLVVRVGPERYEEALALPHARPMDFTGRPTRGFVFVGPKAWSNDATLKKWLDIGIDFASSLPKKRKAR
jgi:TfoX/Sxy family transcriptional regulator of competence genes